MKTDDHPTPDDPTIDAPRGSVLAEVASRILFLFAGGLLLSVLVSCACGPSR